jgi:hypothetical protein
VNGSQTFQLSITLHGFTGTTSSIVAYKRKVPFVDNVVPVTNLISPLAYESLPRLNDDVIAHKVYLEGDMAPAWNAAIDDPLLSIPANLSHYVEFNPHPSLTFARVEVTPPIGTDPLTDNSYLSQFYDTYVLCRTNESRQVCPAHEIQTGAWTTLCVQHVMLDVAFLDSFYIHASSVSPDHFEDAIV